MGVRPLGMSAFAAVADDVNAICWNPAGLSLLQSQEATAAYTPLYKAEISQSYLAYAYPTGKWGTIGVNFSSLDYGSMDWRNDAGDDLGEFSRKDYSFLASYGISLMGSFSLGAAVGATSIRMDSVEEGSTTGVGFDLGALYTIASRMSFGFLLENVGGINNSNRELARQKIRAGAAISVLNKPGMGLVAAVDLEGQQGKADTLYSGFEWSVFSPSSFFVKRKVHEGRITLGKYDITDYTEGLPEAKGKTSLCIRGGVRKRLAVDEPITLSGGVCIRYLIGKTAPALKIDHAFTSYPYLGTTHRFSLGLEFGGI